jgi:hypothetical protein
MCLVSWRQYWSTIYVRSMFGLGFLRPFTWAFCLLVLQFLRFFTPGVDWEFPWSIER